MDTTFLQFFRYKLSVSSRQRVHAWYPLFDCPDRLLSAGQSLMVTKSNARRSKFSCLYSSQTRTPSSFHSSKSSSTNGLRYTSISLPDCFGPWISTGVIMYFRFMHSQEGRLNIQRVTGHILRLLPHSPNGFIPSVLKPNLMFLGSLSKSGKSLSTFLHWDPFVGCLSICSCLRSSLCHRINLALDLFLKKRFKRGITGKYCKDHRGVRP